MIEPFIYYKASEVVTEDRSDCVWEFKVDVQFDFEDEDEDISFLIENLYTITYNPLNKKLERWYLNPSDYNKDDPILREIFLANRYLELYRAFKLKISTHVL